MLGFGAIGQDALGGAGYSTRALTSDILQGVVTELVDVKKLLPTQPPELHHFTALGTAAQILENDNVRLSHAEYSNDQRELAQAKDVISSRLQSRSPHPFFDQVLAGYKSRANELDAYIFCMSMDKASVGLSQDILSQWRAYGQDGRGVALTLDIPHLARIVGNVPTLRINPVIYYDSTKQVFVDSILDAGFASSSSNSNAVDATAEALVFATPLMKAAGFEEEREWRLIFMPPALDPTPKLKFHPRRDFLAPFFDLCYIWKDLRPLLVAIPELAATLPNHRPAANVPPLVAIKKVMVGPSGHQDLNVRAFSKLLTQTGRTNVRIEQSEIPYRSLG
jgi:hypothetical protein